MRLPELLERLDALLDEHEQERRSDPGEENFRCEDCVACVRCRFCVACESCESCTYCEECEQCADCTQCIRCLGCVESSYLEDSRDCDNSRYLTLCVDCTDCTHCLACVGLEGAEFCVLNEQYTRREYFELLRAAQAAMRDRLEVGWRPEQIGLSASPLRAEASPPASRDELDALPPGFTVAEDAPTRAAARDVGGPSHVRPPKAPQDHERLRREEEQSAIAEGLGRRIPQPRFSEPRPGEPGWVSREGEQGLTDDELAASAWDLADVGYDDDGPLEESARWRPGNTDSSPPGPPSRPRDARPPLAYGPGDAEGPAPQPGAIAYGHRARAFAAATRGPGGASPPTSMPEPIDMPARDDRLGALDAALDAELDLELGPVYMQDPRAALAPEDLPPPPNWESDHAVGVAPMSRLRDAEEPAWLDAPRQLLGEGGAPWTEESQVRDPEEASASASGPARYDSGSAPAREGSPGARERRVTRGQRPTPMGAASATGPAPRDPTAGGRAPGGEGSAAWIDPGSDLSEAELGLSSPSPTRGGSLRRGSTPPPTRPQTEEPGRGAGLRRGRRPDRER